MKHINAKGYYAHCLDQMYETIRPYIEGKTVLDCGAAGNNPAWTEFMRKHSKEYVGVDLQNDLKIPDIIIGNVETVDLKRKFDVVLAGGLLAELACQGLFMRNVNRHLKKGGLLIVTHSNCLSLRYRAKGSVFDNGSNGILKTCKHNEHTIGCLMKIHGFEKVSAHFYGETVTTLKRRLMGLLFRFKPKLQDWVLVIGRKEKSK